MLQVCDAFDLLACPVDRSELRAEGRGLRCEHGHSYPGIAVLLRADVQQTIGIAQASLDQARAYQSGGRDDPLFIETLGITDRERDELRKAVASAGTGVDPVVSYLIAATNGILYKNLAGRLNSIPIPTLRLPPADGQRLLDVGCNWGRWSLAAAGKGYRPIGIDPSLGAVLAAKRLAAGQGLSFDGIVGDARHLPLKNGAVDCAFSYSVLQHFSKPDAREALRQIARVTRPDGTVKIQMASATGIRSLYHLARRKFREPTHFDVRYWLPGELVGEFRSIFGNAELNVDCFFGLGLQPSDLAIMPPPARTLVRVSEVLRRASTVVRPLAYVADSVYLTSRNAARVGMTGAL